MGHDLFDQLAFVRGQTLKAAESLTEEAAHLVPEGFRNTLHWQLGHIYTVTERFAFHFLDLPLELPEGYLALFGNGTTPLQRPDGAAVPTLDELKERLAAQPERIRTSLAGRLPEKIEPPYTTSAGAVLASPEQFLSFNLYHEGMHFSMIKVYKKLLGG